MDPKDQPCSCEASCFWLCPENFGLQRYHCQMATRSGIRVQGFAIVFLQRFSEDPGGMPISIPSQITVDCRSVHYLKFLKKYSDPIWKFCQCDSLDIGPYDITQKWNTTIFRNRSYIAHINFLEVMLHCFKEVDDAHLPLVPKWEDQYYMFP